MAEPYPPIEPYDNGMLDVGDGNLVYWEACGAAEPTERERARESRVVPVSSSARGREEDAMPGTEVKNFDSPDEVRPFEGNGKADVLRIGGQTVGRGTFEPGWRWSNNVKPLAGTDSCQVSHLAYVVSGRMGIRMDDGSEVEIGPGDVFACPPGHDAWVVGDQPCVSVDFGEFGEYAKRS